ncbi:MAG: hypothetical protein HY924_11120 [Elusimicrobia bacterium]|nr:hypothetical protein [Elusimicrobiota bacterium]
MSRNRATLVLSSFLLAASLASDIHAAGGLPAADALFDKGSYAEALKGYEALLTDSSKETRLKAFYRSVESQALLLRYAEAAQRASSADLPGGKLWKARMLILRAEVAREYLKQYGFAAPRDPEEGSSDPAKATPEEWHAKVRQAYQGLWDLRRSLAKAPLSEEGYFVSLKDAELEAAPTLWDFVVLRMSGYLLNEAPSVKALPQARSFLSQDYEAEFSLDASPAEAAASLFEETSRMRGKDRKPAAGLWKIRRLLIPFDFPGKVSRSEEPGASPAAAADLLLAWRRGLPGPASAQASLEAAELLKRSGQPHRAVELCRELEETGTGLRAKAAAKLRAELELPSLRLTATPGPPPAQGSLSVESRNLDRVFLRLYRTTPAGLRSMGTRWDQAWSALRSPSEETVASFLSRSPDHAWSVPVASTSPFILTTTTADPPSLGSGLYLALAGSDAAFKPKSTMLSAAILNVTELLLVVTEGPQGPERSFIPDPAKASAAVTTAGFHLYAFDGRTGEPRPSRVSGFRQTGWSGWKAEDLRLDDSGRGHALVSLGLSDHQSDHYSFDPLAEHRGSYAFLSDPASLHHASPAPFLVELETDRPIYRPGQEVRVKATVLTRLPRGWKVYGGGSKLSLKASDANGQTFIEKTLALNSMGSASASFTIPASRLLGSYHLTASITEHGRLRQGWRNFSVEEYKRPEFEVLVHEASGPWKYGQEAAVTGEAKYYFGAPVQDAPAGYKVYREPFLPWWCWWRRRPGSRERTLAASGTARTGPDGRYSFKFTPLPAEDSGPDPMPSRFTVEVDSRDQGGRTISTQRSFKAGAKSLLISMTPSAGFFSSRARSSVEVALLTLDETRVSGEVSFALHRLEAGPKQAEETHAWSGRLQDEPSLEEAFKDAADGPELRRGRLGVSAGKSAVIGLGTLGEGVYRLKVRAQDPWGGQVEQSIMLASAGASKRPLVNLPAVAIPERRSYLPGEKARVLLGATELKGTIYVEVWGGPFLLESRVLAKGGVRVIEVPVTTDHQGGFSVRWFSGQDFKVRGGQAGIEVPRKDRDLTVKLDSSQTLKPGQKVSWRIRVSDRAGKPVSGEALARVFDRSLEYYAAAEKSWLLRLYPARPSPSQGSHSLFEPTVNSIAATDGWIKKLLDLFNESVQAPKLPELRLNSSRVHGRRMFGQAKGMAMAADEAGSPKPEAARGGGPAQAQAVPVRSDFSETALFEPHLKIAAGSGLMSFKAPERLTSWKVLAAVLTKDAKVGVVETEAATMKDLMVRLEVPRFLREGDSAEIKALVHNETDRGSDGSIRLTVKENGLQAHEKLGLDSDSLILSAGFKPRGVTPVSWHVTAPKALASFKIEAAALSGQSADAEEKELPILPSRQRLVETAFASLDGTAKAGLELQAFKEADPTREVESLTLQLDPQLALTVLNSLPFLVSYPFECVEQTLNRFVPLGIVDSFYKKHPGLAEAVTKLPKRDTLAPAWDRTDPRRLTELMESPWQEVSLGRRTAFPLVDLFDSKTVAKDLAESGEKLLKAQNPDGSFPWFPGGRPDPYVTLLVLSGWAEAQRYGVAIPKHAASRALSYIQSEIPRKLKSSLKPDEALVSAVLYAAYVMTSFDQDSTGGDDLWKLARAWADHADLHRDAMTPMGKAYAAHVYWRLGEHAKGERYLDQAMDGSRSDPVAGVYWTPEKLSWLWYNDSVEKHAFLLRTLMLVRPKDPRVPGMVQWLLFNRKGNEWKSTKASAAAIYSLLDVLKNRGALDQGDSYSVLWGPDTRTAAVGPMDWLADPLRWTKQGKAVEAGHEKASITKTGPGLGFASLTGIYTTDSQVKASGPGLLQVSRRFFLRVQEGRGFKLKPLKSGDTVAVGDELEVKLSVTSRSQFEYLHLKDPKPAGLEASDLLSGWKWEGLPRYMEPRDSLTNFFLTWIPHGEYEFGYRLRPAAKGRFKAGAAVLQSMYAPEMSARSESFELNVD